MDTTYWHCEQCGATGAVEYHKHSSVYQVVHLLEDSHNETNGEACAFDVAKVRVSREPFVLSEPSAQRGGEARGRE